MTENSPNDEPIFCMDLITFGSLEELELNQVNEEFPIIFKKNPNLQCYKIFLKSGKIGILSDKFINEKIGCQYELSLLKAETNSDLTFEQFMGTSTNQDNINGDGI